MALIVCLSLLLYLLQITSSQPSSSCANITTRIGCGYLRISQEDCISRGCCWSPSPDGRADEPMCIYYKSLPSDGACDPTSVRSDCGFDGIDEQGCEKKGCCWSPVNPNPSNLPWCYYKSSAPSDYVVQNVQKTPLGVKITLSSNSSVNVTGGFGDAITPLVMEISSQTMQRLHVKIYDPNSKRWEVPTSMSPAPDDPATPPTSTLYNYKYPNVGEKFYLTILRASDGAVIFDTTGQTFSMFDQYLSLSTHLPDNYNIYGLGEHVTPFLKLQQRTYTLWNFDTATPPYLNLYGSHPFYLEVRSGGSAHGVFLRNSNGMDVILSDNSLTYNTIGGIFDLYFFMGPQPESVIRQYQEVIGSPHMPPYWGLGFHQCRYGYHSINDIQDVVENYAKNKIPLDTMWTDIDYMDQYKDFTLDPTRFPPDEMNKFVSSLHSSGQQYVVIIDPGIKVDSSGYSPYTDGINMNIFIKDHEGKVLTGKVWPGITAFPDFFHPNANQYWEDQISKFHQLLPVDGLWIDMNEISNFCNGECSSSIRTDPLSPPYSINNQGNKAPLNTKAISVDAVHYGNVLEYNAHNLFGLTEAIATNKALENVRKTRSFVISRSTFPGSGSHTGHWTGDNHASWDDLYQSIPGMLNFQMFGVPLVGSDICGFIGNTNEELCSRWMQLGAFYPFSRNHNSLGNTPQEPYRWSSVADISRAVLSIRYTIIPYYYTQFYKAHIMMDPLTHSSPTATVVKPIFFEFSDDPKTYDIDKQFLIGNGIMVTPVLTQGATTVDAYFPKGVWYDFYTSASETDQGGITKTLSAPLDHIPIHFRGGHIIPLQYSGLTTAASRANPFGLKVALDGMGQAYGDLFYDDGQSLNITNYIFVSYTANNNSLTAKVSGPGIDGLDMSTLDMVTVMGVSTQPKEATINGNYASLSYDSSTKCMTLSSLDADMTKDFVIKWM